MDWKLYYDGGCNLCEASQLRLVRWAKNYGQPLDAKPLQTAEAIEKGYGMDGMVLEVDGRTLIGADAWLRLMRIAPIYLRWVHYLGRLPGFKHLFSWGYGIVAKYRLKWFGTRECVIGNTK